MSVLAAIDRTDVANYVNALFLVYIILIFARILLSWIPRIPYNPALEKASVPQEDDILAAARRLMHKRKR